MFFFFMQLMHEDIEQFIKNQGDWIGPRKSKQLLDGLSELRGRYDTIVMQSSNRQKKLTRGIEDLEKLEVKNAPHI